MIKRFLHNFTEAAGRGAGYVVGGRGGNDLYGWVKSGEAKKAVSKLGKDAAEAAREARDALVEAGEEAGHAIQEGVQGLRGRFSTGDEEAGGREEQDARARGARAARTAPDAGEAEAELSDDDRAALEAQQQARAAGITARCTHCDAPVRVAPGAELARCPSCDRRFWIELAERD